MRTKKTSNFDACRDLSGKRLRHSKAEDRLREWAKKQAEREKEKKALDAAKKAEKMLKKQEIVSAFAEETQQLQEQTASALAKGLAARQKIKVQTATQQAKREKAAKGASWDILALGKDMSDEDEDDLEDEDFTIYDVGVVTCDECDNNIIGKRWHSVDLDDYDLCDSCYEKQEEQKKGDAYILVIQSLPENEKQKEEDGGKLKKDKEEEEEEEEQGKEAQESIKKKIKLESD